MTIKQLLTHWPILTLIFVSGGAAAWQEMQRQTLEDVVIQQSVITQKQHEVNIAIIKMEQQTKTLDKQSIEIKNKLDMLIELQLKQNGENR